MHLLTCKAYMCSLAYCVSRHRADALAWPYTREWTQNSECRLLHDAGKECFWRVTHHLCSALGGLLCCILGPLLALVQALLGPLCSLTCISVMSSIDFSVANYSKLPRDVFSQTAVPRAQCFRSVCNAGRLCHEVYLVCEHQGLQHLCDRYPSSSMSVQETCSNLCDRLVAMGLRKPSQIGCV